MNSVINTIQYACQSLKINNVLIKNIDPWSYMIQYDVYIPVKCLFVYLFVWGLSSHSRILQSYENVTITGEGLQVLPMLGTRDP